LELSLRGVILVSAVTVLLSVGLVYGIRYEFTPKTNPQTSSMPTVYGVNEQLGFELTLTLEKTEYTLGEPINITLTMTNISNQTTSFGLGYFNYFGFDFQVYNSTNSTIYQWSNRWFNVARLDVVLGETLSAGESLSENLAWPQTSCNSGDFEGYPVLPGTYYIFGRFGPLYYGTNSTIETTPIQVNIAKQ
jgi:hypothetical protein